MKLNTDLAVVLGLTKKEAQIINFLTENPVLASAIGREVNLPRATLDRTLMKLHKRKLICKHKYSARRGGWVSSEFMRLFTRQESRVAFPIKSFVGLSDMRNVEYEFMNTYKNSKCYGIQSVRAWKAWHTKLSKEQAAELNQLLAKNKILMDIIITKEVGKELLKAAYTGRPSLASVVPNRFLSTAFDIEVTHKEVFIMNWERLRGISIQDEEVTQLFKGLIEYIKESSEYYNIHKVLAVE